MPRSAPRSWGGVQTTSAWKICRKCNVAPVGQRLPASGLGRMVGPRGATPPAGAGCAQSLCRCLSPRLRGDRRRPAGHGALAAAVGALAPPPASRHDGGACGPSAPASRALGAEPGDRRRSRLDPLWGHHPPWQLGHQAPNGREASLPVSARARALGSCAPPCAMDRAASAAGCATAWRCPRPWSPGPAPGAGRGLGASPAGLAGLAAPHGPPPLAPVGGGCATAPAAATAQAHAQPLAGRGTAKCGAQQGPTCWVRQGRKLWATEAPEAGHLHVRSCGEGAG
jgi:hypothetical protein